MIWLADWAAAEAGLRDVSLRIGHIGVILEMLEHSGLPQLVQLPLVERLSEAAVGADEPSSEDRVVGALDRWLEQLSGYLRDAGAARAPGDLVEAGPLEDLFQGGRRPGREILARRGRKWDLGHHLSGALRRFRSQMHRLADLRGPAAAVLESLARDFVATAPQSVAKLRGLLQALRDYGIDPDRVELDLGFGRGIGFYSQMVFELFAATASGPVSVCGGGRYDGLAHALGSGRDDRGVGFAFGLERLLAALAAQGGAPAIASPRGTLVLARDEGAIAAAVRLATRLRAEGGRVVLETGRSLEQSYGYAADLGLTRILAVDGGSDGATTYELGPGR